MEKAVAAGVALIAFLILNSYLGIVAPTSTGVLGNTQ